jgi:methionine-S-sulfoxide reductase
MKPNKTHIAAFGMGCFWGPDALFGAEKGIMRTRVGYAGGDKENPTYSNIGDHTETILLEFNPEKISYSELLDIFWDNHHYSTGNNKNQYASRVFYLNEKQKNQAEKSKINKQQREKVATEIQQLNFTVAEDYHQKYRLRHSKLMNNFSEMSQDEFRDSRLAAKLNGYVAGYLNLDDIKEFDLEIEPGLKDRLLNTTRKLL